MKNNILSKILKETPLKTRLEVSNQIYSISLIHELGFREEKYWSEEDQWLYDKICILADIHTKNVLKEIKEWKEDGKPL